MEIRVGKGAALVDTTGAGVALGGAETGRVGMGGKVGNPEQPDATTRSTTQMIVRCLCTIILPLVKMLV